MDDPEIKQLVNEKVDAFWRGVEGGANKRGQVGVCFPLVSMSLMSYQIIVTFSEKRPRKSWFPGIMGEVSTNDDLSKRTYPSCSYVGGSSLGVMVAIYHIPYMNIE